MRISIISSSIASVVSRVIASVVVAGSVVREYLHLSLLREHGFREVLGDWRMSKPKGHAAMHAFNHMQYGNLQPGYLRPTLQRLLGVPTLIPCPATVSRRTQTSDTSTRLG